MLKTWGSEYPGAHGLTLSNEGGESFLWITDEKTGAVGKHTLDGRKVLDLKLPFDSGYYAAAAEYKPTETTVAPDGSVYVADGYGKNYIHRYDSNGRYLSSFAGTGTGPAHLACAHGVTLDTRTATPTLLVTSRSEQSFKRYSLDGVLLDTYHYPNLWVCRPVIKGDHTYAAVIVTDTWYGYDGMVAVFDEEMKLVSAPGSDNEFSYDAKGVLAPPKSDELTFMNPHDVCVDSDDNLYVPQWYSGRTYPVKLVRCSEFWRKPPLTPPLLRTLACPIGSPPPGADTALWSGRPPRRHRSPTDRLRSSAAAPAVWPARRPRRGSRAGRARSHSRYRA